MYDLPPELVVTAEGPVRLVELNRPERLNAASEALHTGLADLWDRLAGDGGARKASRRVGRDTANSSIRADSEGRASPSVS